VIHPREREIVVGTHGRSLYIGEAKEMQQLKADVLASTIKAFEPDAPRWSPRWGSVFAVWADTGKAEMKFPVYVNAAGKVKISIKSDDVVLKTFDADAKKGLNYLSYNLTMDADKASVMDQKLNKSRKDDERPTTLKAAKDGKMYLPRGDYKVVLSKDGKDSEVKLSLK